jgi:hypothetical protein
VLQRFWGFVTAKKILPADALAKLRANAKAVEDVRRGIKIEVLNATLGLEAGYREAVKGDNQIAAALDHLPDAEKMWEAWQRRWAKESPAKK